MKFSSLEERLQWLKATAGKIKQMEELRMRCVVSGDFSRAYSLLKGIKFARKEFQKASAPLRREAV